MPNKTIREICATHLLQTKWLLAPSNRTAHQWIETLVRSGQSVVNLHPTTIIRLALDLIGHELADEGLTLANRNIAVLAIEANWGVLSDDGYLGKLKESVDLSAAVCESLLSLRLAGCTAQGIDKSHFESAAKADDIKNLLAAYEAFLKTHALVDEADVLKRTIAMIGDHRGYMDDDTLVLVPDGIHLDALQQQFVHALPSTVRIDVNHPTEQPARHSTVHFFRAVGETNEIRELLRRCLSGQQPFDDVEILHTHSETYVPLIYATALRFFREPDHLPGIPVTFAEGIPTSLSRPGRALVAWLNWIRQNYPQRLLIEMIGEGLLNCSDDDEVSFSYLVRILRPLAIGSGAENYLRMLYHPLNALRRELSKSSRDENDELQRLAAQRKLKGLTSLRKCIDRLLHLSHTIVSGSGSTTLKAAEEFLTKAARSVSELDRYSTEALIEQLHERQIWLERLGTAFDVQNWLVALPSQTRVLGSGPKPGHIHVANIGSGGQSGRKCTFIVGLDDRRFPGAATEDPILLDYERARLSASLMTSAARLRHKIDELAMMLARLPGAVTLSWSCHDLTDDREMFSSSAVLSAYRGASGQHDADLATLNAAVGAAASFAPTSAEKSLDESERWLWFLSRKGIQGTNQMHLVEQFFPHLSHGNAAILERARDFGAFNGQVPQAGNDLNPFHAEGPVLSASALETAGRCLLAYFFRSGLNLFPLEETSVDLDRWLDAAQFGQLMHDLFRQFMDELCRAGELPDFQRDHRRLAQLLHEIVTQWRSDIPPPNENAYRTQYWQLLRTARIFLQAEEEFCATSRPRFFEVSLGLEASGDGPLDEPNPVTITLPNEKSLRARGRVDRVDETSANRYSIWDYKLGSAYGFDKFDPFQQGRRIQSILYLHMVETALRNKIDPHAIVEVFGYFFPSVRAHGLRIKWSAEELQNGVDVLNRLCAAIESGAFLATDDPDDCRWCDYQSICGDVKRVTSISADLINRDDLVQLKLVRELRRG